MPNSDNFCQLINLSMFVESACCILQMVLSKPILMSSLREQPRLSEVRRCADSGCIHCKLLWCGVLKFFPNLGRLDRTKVFGFVLRKSDAEWLRLGIAKDFDHIVGNAPREWVDFRWSHVKGQDVLPSPGVHRGGRCDDRIGYANIEGNSHARLSASQQATETRPDHGRVADTVRNEVHKADKLPQNLEPTAPSTARILSWLSSCQDNHDSCRFAQMGGKYPTRLIATDLDDGTSDVVLRKNFTAPESYIALSYCWGQSLPLRTTQHNLQSHETRIPWEALPLLFREVITITRRLKIRYIWIDSLCIIQDDATDWSKEAENMAAYYGSAFLTIAADTSTGTTCTVLPQPVVPPAVFSLPNLTAEVRVSKVPIHVSMNSIRIHQDHPSGMPLFSRAWAFQERLMSPRILHLGPEELVWECSSALWCECGDPPDIWDGKSREKMESFRTSHYNALVSGTRLGMYWHDLLEMYLIRHLTFGTDRLKAIMGLAKQISGSENTISPTLGNYVLGLWSSILQNCLLWSNLTRESSRNSCFPSWTWASIDGIWLYQRPPPAFNFISKAVVIQKPTGIWDIDHPKTNKYQLIMSGCTLEAFLTTLPSISPQGSIQWTLRTGLPADNDLDLLVTMDTELNIPSQVRGPQVTCLQVGVSNVRGKKRTWGLVMRAREADTATFERVGIMTASETWYDMGVERSVCIY